MGEASLRGFWGGTLELDPKVLGGFQEGYGIHIWVIYELDMDDNLDAWIPLNNPM